MAPSVCFAFLLLSVLHSSQSLQSGYTCETSVTLTCPENTKLLVLEVTYSSECPSASQEKDGGALYAPSRCLGFSRDRAAALCNGQRTCTIDHSLLQRPTFLIGKQANCEFLGQSVNVDYSCIPEFYSSQLPRIDICSLQSLHGLTEGFLHTPNYPNGYPNSQTCSKTVPSPDVGHRLKIFALDFDVEGLSVLRWLGIKRINDWFQINNSGEKMFGVREAYTLLFDDVIEASLMFKSDFANTKRAYSGFLLYFIVTPIRGPRPLTTSTAPMNTTGVVLAKEADEERSTVATNPKTAALLSHDPPSNSVGLTLLVVLLSGILFVIGCAFLLYKRRNDRRVRYLTDMFQSFFPSRSPADTTLNNTVQSKLDLSMGSSEEKFTKLNEYNEQFLPALKHTNINERRESQEKQIFIENLKTCPSPRRTDQKFNAKEQISPDGNHYSEDPLARSAEKPTNNSLFYEYVDLAEKPEEAIYDVINSTHERIIVVDPNDESVVYAVPKHDL